MRYFLSLETAVIGCTIAACSGHLNCASNAATSPRGRSIPGSRIGWKQNASINADVLKLRGGAQSSSLEHLGQVPIRGGALRFGRKTAKTPHVRGGDATIPSHIFNLVKTIVGVGVLSLPYGIAAFGNQPSALIPALALILSIGILSGYGFSLIGKVCAYTGATSYREAWSRSVSPSTSWIPAWSVTIKTSLACLAYSMVLRDTFSTLLQASKPNLVLLSITTIVLLPLCWLKNLTSLSVFSLAGILGMGYTALAMTIRLFDGSYDTSKSSGLWETLSDSARPVFGDAGLASVMNPKSLILVSMLATAYMSHFLAPNFYRELKNNTLPRFYTVVSCSFGISILLMGFITTVGFLTFGGNSMGLILNNYANNDKLISLSRVAVAFSLVFSYPLVFQGFRDGMLDLLNVPAERRKENSVLNLTTLCLLSIITLLAMVLKDVSFVLAFGGATLGNLLTYIYPAIMYGSVVTKQRRSEPIGVFAARVSGFLGLLMGAVGAKMALDK